MFSMKLTVQLFSCLLTAAALITPSFTLAADAKPAAAEAAPAAPAKPDLAKAEATYGAVCVACHGVDGNSAIAANPKLAQQHPEYLAKQLQEFKSGKRNNAVMKGFATMLKDKELVALGERIYRGGIADRQVPACAACHSPNGAGLPVQYPRLSGQHAEYTATQLTSFRDGVRKNNLQMMQVAAKMNDREIKAVSDYIAGLR
jgi:cytochrome c553